MDKKIYVVVLGYGTPRTSDSSSQRRYVVGCIERIVQTQDIQPKDFARKIHFVFVGGYTNRPYRSEADSLRRAFQIALKSAEFSFTLCEDTESARENIEHVIAQCKWWNLPSTTQVQIFCETSHKPTIQMIVNELWHYHYGFPVIDGIDFDPASLTWHARFRQKYIQRTIEYLAIKIEGPFEWLRWRSRERFLEKAHEKARLEDKQDADDYPGT